MIEGHETGRPPRATLEEAKGEIIKARRRISPRGRRRGARGSAPSAPAVLAVAATFCALAGCEPRLDAVLPPASQQGEPIALVGSGFGASPGSTGAAHYDGKALLVTAWTDTRIDALLPNLAANGPHEVTVKRSAGVFSNAVAHTIANIDADGDGMTDDQEAAIGTDPGDPDTDDDGVWDAEETYMFATNPALADTDGDAMDDRADPAPTTPGPTPPLAYSVVTQRADGTGRVHLTHTYHQENHVLYTPPTVPGGPFILYQTYLEDLNGDGYFDESDRKSSAVGVMNADGTRPRLLTDLDPIGRAASDGRIDALPQASPDGRFIVFVSDRDQAIHQDLRLWVMNFDGSDRRKLAFEPGAAPILYEEMDADPFWSDQGKVTFKRERIVDPSFSRIYVADLDAETMTLSNVTPRTDGPPDSLGELPPGDFDPKISPDGQWLASYRKRDNSLVVEIGGEIIVVGDFDLWVAPVSHPLQPAAESITLLNVDNQVIDMMPRWDQSGTRLAFWSVDFHGVADPADIVVVELALPADPLDPPVVVNRTDVTDGYFAEGRYWSETMPTWDPDPARPDGLLFSATGKLP